ncbi:MAG: tetratricopeptide repeat protein [Flavobacteriales bacterium]
MAKQKFDEAEKAAIASTEEKLQSLEQSLTKTEMYIEENKNSLMVIVLAVIVLFGGYYAYQGLVVKPKAIDAQNAIFTAEDYFKNGKFELALNGDGQDDGFIAIAEDYSGTPAGNLANAYAGLAYAKQGDFTNAIDYLENYSSKSLSIAPMVKSALASAYAETGELEKALSTYEEAAKMNDNKFTSPVILTKAAVIADKLGNAEKAKSLYQKVADNYKNSNEGQNALKMLAKYGVY